MHGSTNAASALANLVANSSDNKIAVCGMDGVLQRLVQLATGVRDVSNTGEVLDSK